MRIAALGVFATAASLSAAAFAQSGPPVPPLLTLGLDGCPAVPANEVQRLVGVELRRSVILDQARAGRDAPWPPATTEVRVACEGLLAAIAIDDPLTDKKVERSVDLGAAAPVARPHLLALSIVELLAASWIELQSNPEPAAPPVGAPPPPEARAAALEIVQRRPGAPRPPRFLAAVAGQTSTAGPPSLGGAVVLSGNLPGAAGSYLGWIADLTFQHGNREVALGRVTSDSATAMGAFLAGVTWGSASVRGGIGARGGGAWLSGAPADPATAQGGVVRGLWWGPLALVEGLVIVRGRVVFGLTIEAGRVIVPVIADVQGADPVAVDGSWLRGTLGVGVVL